MSNFVLISDLIILYHFPAGIATSWRGNFSGAVGGCAWLLWLGASACAGGCFGWLRLAGGGGCLLGFQLAGRWLAGESGCWGFGLRRWLLRLASAGGGGCWGWGVWLLGLAGWLRLAGVGAACWGFGLRGGGWLGSLAAGVSACGGGWLGWLRLGHRAGLRLAWLAGVAGSAREAACWLRLGDLSQLAGVPASAWGLARFGLGRVVGVLSARSQSVLVSASYLGCRSAQGRP